MTFSTILTVKHGGTIDLVITSRCILFTLITLLTLATLITVLFLGMFQLFLTHSLWRVVGELSSLHEIGKISAISPFLRFWRAVNFVMVHLAGLREFRSLDFIVSMLTHLFNCWMLLHRCVFSGRDTLMGHDGLMLIAEEKDVLFAVSREGGGRNRVGPVGIGIWLLEEVFTSSTTQRSKPIGQCALMELVVLPGRDGVL